jgi:Ala-tRNA(Pro) deacylase
MPPFENLHGLHVYADKSLAGDKEIVFNGGSHLDLVKLAFRDFERLVEPTIADLAIPRSANRVA